MERPRYWSRVHFEGALVPAEGICQDADGVVEDLFGGVLARAGLQVNPRQG